MAPGAPSGLRALGSEFRALTHYVAPMPEAVDQYGTFARFYDRVMEPLNAPLGRLALRMHPVGEGDTVLDVGCGTGVHLESYAEAGAACHGVDLSPAMLAVARDRLSDSVQLSVGSATELPHDDNTFDVVLASLLIHELTEADRRHTLASMFRVVKPEGVVVVIDYRSGPLRFKGRLWRTLTSVIERIAGREHFREWSTFLRNGGLAPCLPEDATVVSERVLSGGNLSITILSSPAGTADSDDTTGS